MDILEVLKQCTIEGNVVKLPNIQLDRKEYTDVKKKLELIGGSWKGGKVAGFVFKEDPTELLTSIQNGDNRNTQKEYQFFPTPSEIADLVIDLAYIDENNSVLEPSAGQGALIEALNKTGVKVNVDCYELMPINQKILEDKVKNANLIGENFLEAPVAKKYDRIIANPPFNKGQYMEHTYKMYELLEEEGILVVLLPLSWRYNSNKKEQAFKHFIEEHMEYEQFIERGSFKSSGTMIETEVVVLSK